ncbi:MAG TPA: ABC transporter ATP-binding protein [Acidimicrobiales bacterium]
MVAIEVESLTITYGVVVAVDDLSFRAEAGRVTCVLGPNGAGKTSTIEALEGLRRPASGRLEVIGLDPRRDHRTLTRRMGVMLQDGGLHPAARVGETLRHAAALYAEPLEVTGLLSRLGLDGLDRRTVRQLSGGEYRRLALALALVGRPQVAFLDEPTAGIDPAGRQVIRQTVAELRDDGVTVLLTTHDLDEAERMADDVVIIDRGRPVAAGTLDELMRGEAAGGPAGGERVRFTAPAGIDTRSLGRHLATVAPGAATVRTGGGAAGAPAVEVTERSPGTYEVAAPPTPTTVAEITAWLAEHDIALADLHAGRQRLEDVFLRLTGEGEARHDPGGEPAMPGAPDAGDSREGPGATDPDEQQTEPGAPDLTEGPGGPGATDPGGERL